MATLVKFLKDTAFNDEILAYFPQFNYNRELYGKTRKTCYSHVGQHSACHIDYAKKCVLASKEEYKDLLEELISIGYNLKVLNK